MIRRCLSRGAVRIFMPVVLPFLLVVLPGSSYASCRVACLACNAAGFILGIPCLGYLGCHNCGSPNGEQLPNLNCDACDKPAPGSSKLAVSRPVPVSMHH